MTIDALQKKFAQPIFSNVQVERVFLSESKYKINQQLARLEKRGKIIRLKRGLYQWAGAQVGELVIAYYLYPPSYVSLETALSIYGIKPEIPAFVTSISPINTKTIKTQNNTFSYSKIKQGLFFGFIARQDPLSGLIYQIAEPEKALLDYILVRRINSLIEERVNWSLLHKEKISTFARHYPNWVRKVIARKSNE